MNRSLSILCTAALVALGVMAVPQAALADGCSQTCNSGYCNVYSGFLYCVDTAGGHCTASPSTCLYLGTVASNGVIMTDEVASEVLISSSQAWDEAVANGNMCAKAMVSAAAHLPAAELLALSI